MTTKADQAAAERLLKAAVRRAVEVLRSAAPAARVDERYPDLPPSPIVRALHDDVVAMLRAAGESAELLLSERAPKKAAS